jgi:NAD-dependent deacetylase sirtuin 2
LKQPKFNTWGERKARTLVEYSYGTMFKDADHVLDALTTTAMSDPNPQHLDGLAIFAHKCEYIRKRNEMDRRKKREEERRKRYEKERRCEEIMMNVMTNKGVVLTRISIQEAKELAPPPIEGLESLDFDGLISFIINGYAKKVVFLTGAGTSVAAGIPDIRSPKVGIYSNLERFSLPSPEAVFSIGYFDYNPKPFFQVSKNILPGSFNPVAAHFLPTLFSRHNILQRLYTQNIDSLDRAAGTPEDKIIECHGNYLYNTCRRCGKECTYEEYEEEFKSGEVVYCHYCGNGVVKPNIVFFSENLPQLFHEHICDDLREADLLIVMGTSLAVEPCNRIPGDVGPNCVRVLINMHPVAQMGKEVYCKDENNKLYDLEEINSPHLFKFNHILNRRDIFIRGDCQHICRQIIDALGLTDEYMSISGQSEQY